MKAVAVFPEEHALRLVEHREPAILAPGDVVVRVLDVGFCGIDREIASYRTGTPPADSPYLILGHEALGEVVEVGSAVRRIRPGDLVVPTVRRPCRHETCRACRMGRPDFCLSGQYTQRGIKEAHGFLAERFSDDARWLQPVPRELRDVGVLTQPLALAETAIAELEQVQKRLPWAALGETGGSGKRAVVLGAGPVALLGTMALVVRGYKVTIYSRGGRSGRSGHGDGDGGRSGQAGKAEFAESLGAQFVRAEEEKLDSLVDRTGRIDVMLEATGATPEALAAMEHLGRNGVYLMTGIPGRRGAFTLDAGHLLHGMVQRNQVIIGPAHPSAEAYRAAIQDLALFSRRWPGALARLISSRMTIDEAPAVFRKPAAGLKQVVAVAE
jgi:threonine dehydrogenase-like Zn-dependent dehydrogenase